MQNITSANTSVNSINLPALFNKVNLKNQRVFDLGCGKFTNHIEKTMDSIGSTYHGFDPFNQSDEYNESSVIELKCKRIDCIVCSNVLNVIDSDKTVSEMIEGLNEYAEMGMNVFVTVYEGNKSGIGKVTKSDCYQRNEKTREYLKHFNDKFVIKKGVITNNPSMVK